MWPWIVATCILGSILVIFMVLLFYLGYCAIKHYKEKAFRMKMALRQANRNIQKANEIIRKLDLELRLKQENVIIDRPQQQNAAAPQPPV